MDMVKKCLWIGGLLHLVVLLCCKTATASPEGINIYKDILRGKNEEDEFAVIVNEEIMPKLAFFRTPLYSLPDINGGEVLGKRTVNKYKNMMLNKDDVDDHEQSKEAAPFSFPRVTPKRSPGAILSWAIPAANRVRLVNTYRPPGIDRPAA
ncbi:uncharacterized protein LOC129768452 [Toxorhynchites rutilus septentrionalis]|uniref:uncharacterized protein LOC129768452 n=1 Tax=Toxorhynchites rutilus septentrionalis TaxID=329112 RepID=UPI002478FB06|nr:uncharacterized protein LOC129768452 [Toxorhynchites rutilus septentrionalis]